MTEDNTKPHRAIREDVDIDLPAGTGAPMRRSQREPTRAPEVDLPTLLRAAAGRLTKLADQATPGPWLAGVERAHLVDEVVYGPSTWKGNIEQVCSLAYGRNRQADSKWIAQMSPAIARPLVSWLKDVASDLDEQPYPEPSSSNQQYAVALARAIYQVIE